MPYRISRGSGSRPWKIKKPDGTVVGSSESREQAEASVRARYASEKKRRNL